MKAEGVWSTLGFSEIKVSVAAFFSSLETGFLYIVLAVLELTLQIRLTLNSQESAALSEECWD